jgi:protein-tyrosine phosphatase
MFPPVHAITKENPYKVCFVCLGNICRSPTAEGIMQHKVNEKNLQPYFYIDSAGTAAYHVGEGANATSRQIAKGHGVDLLSRARQFSPFDFQEFDLILAMDQSNLTNIMALDPPKEMTEKIMLMRAFDEHHENADVPDPYYGGIAGFEHVFAMLERSVEELISQLAPHIDHS